MRLFECDKHQTVMDKTITKQQNYYKATKILQRKIKML